MKRGLTMYIGINLDTEVKYFYKINAKTNKPEIDKDPKLEGNTRLPGHKVVKVRATFSEFDLLLY